MTEEDWGTMINLEMLGLADRKQETSFDHRYIQTHIRLQIDPTVRRPLRCFLLEQDKLKAIRG